MGAGRWQEAEGQRGDPLPAGCSDGPRERGSSCRWRWTGAAGAGSCFSPSLGGRGRPRVPRSLSTGAAGGASFIHRRCVLGSAFEGDSPLAPFQQLGMFSVKAGVVVVEDLKKQRRRVSFCHLKTGKPQATRAKSFNWKIQTGILKRTLKDV